MVFICLTELAQILKNNTAMEINEFLKAANETNKANDMAFRYAVLILEDLKNLTP